MVMVVVSAAAVILFSDAYTDRLYGDKRMYFVMLLCAYAVYRIFRIRQLFRRPDV